MNRFEGLSGVEREAAEAALTAAFVLADSTEAWALLIDALDATESPAPHALSREAVARGVRWATLAQKQDFAEKFVAAIVRGTSGTACDLLIAASALAMREAVARTHPIWDELAGTTPAGPLSAPTPEKPTES
ncbi:hypothetical protein NG702_19525 [Pseudarthrobacter sp. MDT3-28]|uniref:hypothetical protein n=1 Tax=Pseudarthrobacter raffinosi TaxID=2953651 RepID=UPI00208EA441|nr:hypothetical protein [Pseudarthrobacter sp. MDT3-28]MCO4239568.1 hypothetical protein [Pseudarthrobacter sp. MDT3-28]